jgi:hypothetical protein
LRHWSLITVGWRLGRPSCQKLGFRLSKKAVSFRFTRQRLARLPEALKKPSQVCEIPNKNTGSLFQKKPRNMFGRTLPFSFNLGLQNVIIPFADYAANFNPYERSRHQSLVEITRWIWFLEASSLSKSVPAELLPSPFNVGGLFACGLLSREVGSGGRARLRASALWAVYGHAFLL